MTAALKSAAPGASRRRVRASAEGPAGYIAAASARRTRTRLPRLLFVDFDGVLHPTTADGALATDEIVHTTLFGWLPELAAVLRPHPDVVLVVHSTWRLTHDIEELRALLGALGGRVVGSTPPGARYASILDWLKANPLYESYRILDDALGEFPTPPPRELILCKPSSGLAAPKVLAALRRWLEAREADPEQGL